jgi:hypothetical protein
MKRLAAVLLLFSMCALAKDRAWQDAEVRQISSGQGNGTAIAPVGTMVMAIPFSIVTLYYYVRVGDMLYVLACNSRRKLNVTEHGKTKISIDSDGKHAHILDDGGKDIKIALVQKINKPLTEAAK